MRRAPILSSSFFIMLNFTLPTSADINGTTYKINTDYRDIINICIAIGDVELTDAEKTYICLYNFYPEHDSILREDYEEALKYLFWFIRCGEDEHTSSGPKLVDWEKDFKYIVAPINKALGQDIRATDYMHWWTFVSYYYEIGECLFSQIVRIRDAIATGKKLDKADKDWLRKNTHLVHIETKYTQAEEDLLAAWATK